LGLMLIRANFIAGLQPREKIGWLHYPESFSSLQ